VLLISILIFSIAWWFGLYLISRDVRDVRLLAAGTALVICALFAGYTVIAGIDAALPVSIVLLVLTLIGAVAVRSNARERGERLLPHVIRAFDYSMFAALLFGVPVALTMALAQINTLPMRALLLVMVGLAVAVQIFADPLENAIDRFAFKWFPPQLWQARRDLRAAASAVPRLNPALDLAALDEAEFSRLTRRALSDMGDLPRLSASALTYLPTIEQRLKQRGAPDNTLERAAELKTLLCESIERLKPREANGAGFGATDAWRHYNALYFPYIIGMKPYSSRYVDDVNGSLSADSHAALEWFRVSVPERTLHNWQTAAARLVAQDIRERI